jgi:hypothetical protein
LPRHLTTSSPQTSPPCAHRCSQSTGKVDAPRFPLQTLCSPTP